jgi:uncharacterized SAM-binding protein YcdF (DUF218 family)
MSRTPAHQPNACVSAAPRQKWRAVIVSVLSVVVAVAAGFVGFLSQLHGTEAKPSRSADGIVVLTGGSSRVSDAMELLADGYGRRLLISGVHPASGASDISRSLTDNQSLLSCCVDLDRQHPQQRRRDATLGA